MPCQKGSGACSPRYSTASGWRAASLFCPLCGASTIFGHTQRSLCGAGCGTAASSGLGWCASFWGFALITLEFWDCSEWHVVALYSAFLIGEAAWMFLTAWQWNRFCLLTMTAAAGLLAVEAYARDPHSIAVAPAALLAAHVGLWDAVFWMRTWEAELY